VPPLLPRDADLDYKVKKSVERVSENLLISSNEPSLALYRLQEHVRRAAPPTVARRGHVRVLQGQLAGACYDLEYALGAVQEMSEAAPTLAAMQEALKEAVYYRQQLRYETQRRLPSQQVDNLWIHRPRH